MKARLIELGEMVLGATWWGLSWAWGLAFTAMLLLAPLIFGNFAAEFFDALSATAALAIGVAAAYVIGLPPWDADERLSLPLLVGGTTASVVVWDLIRGSADAGTLLVALALTVVGWPIRRIVPAWD
jgi:hypothetical protein